MIVNVSRVVGATVWCIDHIPCCKCRWRGRARVLKEGRRVKRGGKTANMRELRLSPCPA